MWRQCFLGALLFSVCIPLSGCGGRVEGALPRRETDGSASRELGFNAAFKAELARAGQISSTEFSSRYAPPDYLPRPTWDPTTAKFYERLMSDPKELAAEVANPLQSHPREQIEHLLNTRPKTEPYDFRMNAAELELYQQNGFVVSERMSSHSFTDLYHRIYVRDLPVFVTADSMLHAWHMQFDQLLEDLETNEIQPLLVELLAAMASQLPLARDSYEHDLLQDSLADVDFFLCVAQRMIAPTNAVETVFDQDDRVQKVLDACDRLTTQEIELFGQRRIVDFSHFKPRGRYAESDRDRQYFRALMWLGRIDFRLAGTKNRAQELRELGAVIVLNDLLQRTGRADHWRELDHLLQRFLGQSDCLNFSQVDALLAEFNVESAAEMTQVTLDSVHQQLAAGRLPTQQIRGDYFCVAPANPDEFVLPTNFAFLGQRFILDSWALTKVVYDSIKWSNEKVYRRIPSSLDMSFAVLGNNHVTPRLQERLTNVTGKPFRDNLPYQHNLAAARNVIDNLPSNSWNVSIYSQWMGCLRELTVPAVDDEYPEAVRTAAWAQKATTTQLASWTQLRHDTVLYAKPSYTRGVTCYYPAGYVEPIPHFWRRFDNMVNQTKEYFEQLQLPVRQDPYAPGQGRSRMYRVKWLQNFVSATRMLRSISEKQFAQDELNEDEVKFLQEIVVRNNMCGAPPIGGWYPALFSRRGEDDAHKWTALVTDIHTNPPDPLVTGDPGCVLHQGIGNVDLIVVAIDNGSDRVVYLGPVFSHYEFETARDERLTNDEWKDQLRAGKFPPREREAASYLAPGTNSETPN